MLRNEREDQGGAGTDKLIWTKHIVGKYLRTNFKHYEKEKTDEREKMKEEKGSGQRDHASVNTIYFSCRGPELHSQHQS